MPFIPFLRTNIGATFPGQAILLSSVVEILALPMTEVEHRGNFLATMFIVLAAGCLISYFILGYATNTVAQHLGHKLRKRCLHDILHQDVDFFDREENSTGALVARVDSNPQAILELMGYNIGLVLIAGLNALACAVLALIYSWKLGLVVTCAGLAPLVGSGYLKIRLDANLDRNTSKRYSVSASIASEAVTSIRTISSLAIENSVLERYTRELDEAMADLKRPLFTVMASFAFTQSAEYWFLALGFWYGCRLLSFGEVTLYAFIVAFLGVFFSGQSASQLFQFSTSITKGINAANYLFWLNDLQKTVQKRDASREEGPDAVHAVDLDKVKFSYPRRPEVPVLKGLDLSVRYPPRSREYKLTFPVSKRSVHSPRRLIGLWQINGHSPPGKVLRSIRRLDKTQFLPSTKPQPTPLSEDCLTRTTATRPLPSFHTRKCRIGSRVRWPG